MKQLKFVLSLVLVLALSITSCRKYDEHYEDPQAEWLSGGKQTFFDAGTSAFGHMFEDMDFRQIENHEIGDKAFEATFITAPAPMNYGLGPLYNNVSCASCHANDGRGKPPEPNDALSSMLFRVSIPGSNPHGGPNPLPGYGGQFQPRVIAGKVAEGNVSITYSNVDGIYADGTHYSLRSPTYSIINAYTSLPGNVMLSPRVAPPVFGLGLLEAISEGDIMKYADASDVDGDGISGKANTVWDVLSNSYKLGRFGWKAGQPNLLQQSAGAYNEDMGITNLVFPSENSFQQPQYDGLDDDTELADSVLHAVAFYMQTLGVPARRNAEDPVVKAGKIIFRNLQCASCHVEQFRTRVDVAFTALSNQKIFPYTDLLLHNMGPGLADNRPEFEADGFEWRTPPLWGIGLTKKVNGHAYFLHDGRARNLTEAILWHGGEAEKSKQGFTQLSASDREAIIKFLESL